MNKILITIGLFLLLVVPAIAQKVVRGTVADKQGNPVSGVEFFTSGEIKSIGVTDSEGQLTASVDENQAQLYFIARRPFIASGRVDINAENSFELVLSAKDNTLNIGRNIKRNINESSFSFGSIKGEELDRINDQDVAAALYGRIAGLSVMQNTGSTMDSAPVLRVRGNNSFNSNIPLVLIDGVARSMADVSLPEVESITVLKDATASALYGVRGANGVIQVTTKRGAKGKTKVNVAYRYNHFTPFRAPEMVDGATYAQLYNEALVNDGLSPLYTQDDIAAFKSGSQPYTHPNVDWADEAYASNASSQVIDITAKGGTDKFRYFTSAVYANEKGLFQSDMLSTRDDHKLGKVSLNIRSNIDVQLYENTKFSINVAARMSEFREPKKGYRNIARSLYSIPALAFPVYSSEGVYASTNFYGKNPIADINSSGFSKNINRTIVTDFRLYQNLDVVLKGLSAEAAISYDATSIINEYGTRDYQYHVIDGDNITAYGEDTPMKYGDKKTAEIDNNNIEAKLNYQKLFGRTNLNAAVIYQQSSYSTLGRNKRRARQSIIANASLAHKNKYLLDAVVNYSGSSVMPEGDQYKVFPAVSLGWIASKEDFMKDSAVDYLKFRGSYGLSGSDAFDHDLFLQKYTGAAGYLFNDNITGGGGSKEGALPVVGLEYEIAKKLNFGFDIELFKNRLSLTTDLFYEQRENMLVDANNVISKVIGIDLSKQVNGEIKNKGIEVTALWQDNLGDFKYSLGGNFTFARNEIVENNEGFVPYSYLSRIGTSKNANFGLEAIGFFADDADIAASPQQVFGEVRPGDIKYKDQNNDGIIDNNDRIVYGESGSSPEMYFGFQFNFEYKNVGLSANFQGVANRTLYTNAGSLFFPLMNGTNISKYYVEENVRWTEATKATANMPRLTTMSNPNNFQASTNWFVNGSYLKLRNVELYYNLDSKWLNGIKAKLFVRGANLFSIDNIKHFDPENIENGYPSMSSVSVGAKLNF